MQKTKIVALLSNIIIHQELMILLFKNFCQIKEPDEVLIKLHTNSGSNLDNSDLKNKQNNAS